MPSLLESVTDLLAEGDAFDRLGELMGGDAEQAQTATTAAVPALLDGLAGTATADDGRAAVMTLLGGDTEPVLDDLPGFLERGKPAVGNGILDTVFGAGRGQLISELASQTELANSMVGKLLPMLAPVVVGVVGQHQELDGLDGDGVTKLLTVEREGLEAAGLLGIGTAGGNDDATSVTDDGPSDQDEAKPAADDAVPAAAAGAGAMFGSRSAGDAPAEDGVTTDGETAESGEDSAEVDGADRDAAAASTVVDDEEERAPAATGAAAGSTAADAPGSPASDDQAPAPAFGGTEPDDAVGGLAWLWWALGAVVLVLLLAWLLSTCNDEETGDGSGSGATDQTEAGGDGATTDSVIGAGDDSQVGGSGGGGALAAAGDAELQAEVDEVLDGSGVTGTVVGGVVTLTGEVASEEIGAGAETAVSLLEVRSVVNELEIVGADGEGSAPSTGDTINELLDLDPVTFRVSSARITAEGQAVLDLAATYLAANPDLRIEIGGHTDSDGTEEENLLLSQLRADSVKAYLEAAGIDGDRMETEGYGEAVPKVANESSAAKAQNRRIEFTIL